MKTYTRDYVHIRDIKNYMKCPMLCRLKLLKDDEATVDGIFYSAIEETIMHMYMLELSNGHKAEFSSIRSFWEKVFWKQFPGDEAVLASQYSEKGLDIVLKYYNDMYSICDVPVAAIKAPHEILLNNEKVGVPVTLDVVLVDEDRKEVCLLLFTSDSNYCNMSAELTSSVENMVKILAVKQETPSGYSTKATIIYTPDISIGHTIEITDEIASNIEVMIKYIVAGMQSGISYKSRTEACNTCEFRKECKI